MKPKLRSYIIQNKFILRRYTFQGSCKIISFLQFPYPQPQHAPDTIIESDRGSSVDNVLEKCGKHLSGLNGFWEH